MEFEIIHTYTRREAIADGVLIDVTDAAKLEGFRVPVAFTQAFYAEAISAPCRGANEPVVGRVHEVLWDLFSRIRSTDLKSLQYSPWLPFTLDTTDGEGVDYSIACKVHSGPGDEGEHVLTVMMGDED